jgi:hypothetical protein
LVAVNVADRRNLFGDGWFGIGHTLDRTVREFRTQSAAPEQLPRVLAAKFLVQRRMAA